MYCYNYSQKPAANQKPAAKQEPAANQKPAAKQEPAASQKPQIAQIERFFTAVPEGLSSYLQHEVTQYKRLWTDRHHLDLLSQEDLVDQTYVLVADCLDWLEGAHNQS